MSPDYLQACEAYQPAVKACWEILLREALLGQKYPAAELDAGMGEVLGQVWRVLHETSPEGQLAAAKSELAKLPVHGKCLLRAHLPYFGCGRRALELIAEEILRTQPELRSPQSDSDREALLAGFDLVVQCQIEVLCQACPGFADCTDRDEHVSAHLPHLIATKAPRVRAAKRRRGAKP